MVHNQRLSPQSITKEEVEQYLQLLVGKTAWISCGYGGVVFLEVDGLQKHSRRGSKKKTSYLYSGEYRIFCDENWEFVGKRKKIERWRSSSKNVDGYFDKINLLTVEKIAIEGTFDKTHFYFAGGYRWTIIKDDAIDTFHFTLSREHINIYINGDGSFEKYLLPEYPQHPWRQSGKGIKKRIKKKPFTLQTKFFRKHYPGLFSISSSKTKELVSSVLGTEARIVTIDSATKFSLEGNEQSWRISIDEIWELYQDNQLILSAQRDKFFIKKPLDKALVGRKIKNISFDEDGKKLQISFEGNLLLKLIESDRFSRWDIHLYELGFHISSMREQGLVYRAEYKRNEKEFATGDIYLDAILSELYVYRAYFNDGEAKGWDW